MTASARGGASSPSRTIVANSRKRMAGPYGRGGRPVTAQATRARSVACPPFSILLRVSSYETARAQWDEGVRRLDDAYPEQAPTLERVTRAIQSELRRRLGG